ncbi:unnamed protein product [Brassica oleracea var. botrytis]
MFRLCQAHEASLFLDHSFSATHQTPPPVLFPSHLMHPCHYFSRHLWSENLHWSFPCEKLEHYDAKNVHVTSQSGYPCLSILWGNVTQCCIKN